MPEDDDQTSAASGLIPEFYFDIIARVVPGTAALALYVLADVAPAAVSGFVVTLVIIGGYLVGIVAELLSEALWHWLLVRWAVSLARKTSPGLSRWHEEPMWEWLRGLPDRDRSLYTKVMAEKNLFRSMTLVSLLAAVFPPKLPLPAFYQHFPWIMAHPRLAAGLAFAVFFFCFIHFQGYIFRRWCARERIDMPARAARRPR